tara:strand:- start:30 stop:344 length:315 start_codon:yes stop_codon:yes gene_type:complete
MGKSGPVWSIGSILNWFLVDFEIECSVFWKRKSLGVIVLSVGSLRALSSDTLHGESVVNLSIWDGDFKAEAFLNPVDWSGGDNFEVLKIGVRGAHLCFFVCFLN